MPSNVAKILYSLIFLLLCSMSSIANSVPRESPERFIRSFYESLEMASEDPKRIQLLKNFFAEPLYELLLTNELYRDRSKGGPACGYLDSVPFYDTHDDDKAIKYMHVAESSHHTLVAIAFKYDIKPYLIVKLIAENNE